jgi:hypothetical protein
MLLMRRAPRSLHPGTIRQAIETVRVGRNTWTEMAGGNVFSFVTFLFVPLRKGFSEQRERR